MPSATNDSRLVTPCPVCGSANTQDYFLSEVKVLCCTECSHVFSDVKSITKPEKYGPEYYEQTHRKWFENPNYRLFSWIGTQISHAKSVLDVGCGKGALLKYLRSREKSYRLLGIDFSSNASEEGIEYRQGDFTKMVADERFDAVVSLAVIEHVENPVSFAAALAARCSANGKVIVMTLDNGSLLYLSARILAHLGLGGPARRLYSAHHLQHFTEHSLRRVLEEAGLDVIAVYRHNTPLRSIDIPGPNVLARAVFSIGVVMLFLLGVLTRRTYLQTIVSTPRAS